MRTITILREYMEQIRNLTKILEVRVGYPNIRSIHSGEELLLLSGPDRQTVLVRRVGNYRSFDQMLEHEDYCKIVPGLSKEGVLDRLRQIYPSEKEALGVVALEVEPVVLGEPGMRRNYKANKMACVEMYLIYRKQGFEAAARFADHTFGKNESSNWALRKKFELYDRGGWEKDWLTCMYKDLDEVLTKYQVTR